MRFVYRLEPGDYRALVEAVGLRRRFGQPPQRLWYGLGAMNVAIAGFWVFVTPQATRAGLLAALSGALAAFAFAVPWYYGAYMRRAARRHPAYGLEVVATLADHEIVASYGDVVERIPYASLRSIDERPEHLLLWIDRRRAVVLPKRGLADGITIAAVRRHLEEGR